MLKTLAVCLLLAAPLTLSAGSVQETHGYSFPSVRSDSGPIGTLAIDSAGTVYGVAYIWNYTYIFQLQANSGFEYTETTIYNFHTSTVLPDATASGDLVVRGPGQLLGTTGDQGEFGCGTLFSLTAPTSGTGSWTAEILYSFPCSSPNQPYYIGSLQLVGGNLYAVTSGGDYGHGSVIELASASGGGLPWTKQTIYSFTGGTDGGGPQSLIAGPNGSFYGATSDGGINTPGGTVFQLSPPAQPGGQWSESVLLNLPLPGAQGTYINGTLGLDAQGNVYGVAIPYSSVEQLYPIVFELSPPIVPGGVWTETNLATIGDGDPSTYITSGVFVARGGDVYGSAKKPKFNYTHSYVYQLIPPANAGDPWLQNLCFQSTGTTPFSLTTLGPDLNSLYGGDPYYYFGEPGYVFMLSQ
jgi:hypothetical protein